METKRFVHPIFVRPIRFIVITLLLVAFTLLPFAGIHASAVLIGGLVVKVVSSGPTGWLLGVFMAAVYAAMFAATFVPEGSTED